MTLAAVRPDEFNFPLLLHVLGAMLLVGGLVAAVTALLLGWRRDSVTLGRLGFWSLLLVAFPAWWLMRLAGEWIRSREGISADDPPAWVEVGYITAEPGGVILLLSIILSGIGARRLRRGDGGPSNFSRTAGVLASIALLAYIVAVWAMTAKPD